MVTRIIDAVCPSLVITRINDAVYSLASNIRYVCKLPCNETGSIFGGKCRSDIRGRRLVLPRRWCASR